MDPFGSSDPNDLKNYGHDVHEHNYIFMHDQEPIHLDLHGPLFDDVVRRNLDLDHGQGPRKKSVIVSERDSEFVSAVCDRYGWSSFYYFFHGWAALDWYRGYDKTFLIPDPQDRKISTAVLSPNRIIGGKRDHRVLLMYHLLRDGIGPNEISFPSVCPVERMPVTEMARRWQDHYPDIVDVFQRAHLPWHMSGESDHPMHSCWLSLFDQSAVSLCYLVTETVYFGRRLHLTEKTFKPICLRMPFIMVSAAGSLEYLRSYGFQTFGSLWDESYDHETDDLLRMQRITNLVRDLDRMTTQELHSLYNQARPIVEHNFQHFYGGDFTKILWTELNHMLEGLKHYHND